MFCFNLHPHDGRVAVEPKIPAWSIGLPRLWFAFTSNAT